MTVRIKTIDRRSDGFVVEGEQNGKDFAVMVAQPMVGVVDIDGPVALLRRDMESRAFVDKAALDAEYAEKTVAQPAVTFRAVTSGKG